MMPLRNSAPVENHYDLQLFTPVGCEEQMDMGGGGGGNSRNPDPQNTISSVLGSDILQNSEYYRVYIDQDETSCIRPTTMIWNSIRCMMIYIFYLYRIGFVHGSYLRKE